MRIIVSDKKRLNTTPAKLKKSLENLEEQEIEIYIRDLDCIKSKEHYYKGLKLLKESIIKIYEEQSEKEVLYADNIAHWFFRMPVITIKTGWRVRRKLRKIK